MKKRMSRILSVLLISALVVSTAEVAHAEDVTEPVSEEVQTVEAVEETEEDKAAVEEVAAEPVEEKEEVAAEAVKEEPKTEEAAPVEVSEEVPEMKEDVKEASEAEVGSTELMSMGQSMNMLAAGDVSWNRTSYNFNRNSYYGFCQPVNLSAGTVLITASHKAGNGTMYFGLYTDSTLQKSVATGESAVPKGETRTYAFEVPASGQYYLGIYSYIGSSSNETYTANVTYANLSGADRAIGNNQNILVGQIDAQTNYFTFRAPYTGYLTVTPTTQEAVWNYVALCNSGKRALTGNLSMRNTPTYGVKAGTTYCIRIQSSYNSNGGYAFKVTNNPIKEKSGKTKKKAVTIKQKKTKKGTITAGSKQADWYKFKLKKKKSVRITFKGRTNDRFKVTVYKGGRKIGSRTYWYSDASMTLKSIGKWTKGTYYIKVQRASSTSSGWYSLKWK